MNNAKRDNMMTASAVALAITWMLGWAIALPAPLGSPAVGVAVELIGLVPLGAMVYRLLRRQRQGSEAIHRYLTALCQVDVHQLGLDAIDRLPPLSSASPWRGVAEQVRRAFHDLSRRTQELEQSRAALEVRCRRAAAQTDQIHAILSGMPEPILVVDSYDELVLANSSAEQLFQLEGRKPEDRAVARLVHCQKLVDLLLSTAHHKTVANRSEEMELADAAGQPRWYRVTAARLAEEEAEPAAEETPAGAVAVLRDIGDQKTLQKRNAEFVSSVSHEMKAPLAGIKAYVELLADGEAEDAETREEFLGVINGQADRLQRLVENLLNLARIEAGVVKVSKESHSLNEVLEEAMHVVQPSAEAKNIALVNDLSPMYLGVLADRDMLLQAAINLLSNAIKYTPAGGCVTLRSRMENDQARFEVQDTGVGLSPDDCQRVFEKFYRVNKNKDMAPGTGLGLPLAKHIVEDVHGGRLWVESTLGQGSTFGVTLPNVGRMNS